MSRVAKALANFPGKPVLLNDVDAEPEAVFSGPKARVVVRWLVVVGLVGLLFGLLAWSYATSSELASGIQVERTYQPTMEDISKWEENKNTFTCPCTSMRNTVDWTTVIPQSIWQQFDDMQAPNGPAGTPQYKSFCVSNVLVGGNKPGCKVVRHDGYNTPNDYDTRGVVMNQYPGSTLQAPACRAIAANLMRLNRTGLPASHLLSRMGLNKTVHNAMNDTMYRTAAQVQSTMMMLWNLDVAPDMVNPSWNGFYDGSGGSSRKDTPPETPAAGRRLAQTPPPTKLPIDGLAQTPTPTQLPSDGPTQTPPPTERPMDGPTQTPPPTELPSDGPTQTPPPTDLSMDGPTQTPPPAELPMDGPTQTPRPAVTQGYGYPQVRPIGGMDTPRDVVDYDCAANNSCATEDCLLQWFSDHISSIATDYPAFFDACKPDFCDVVIKKSLVTKVVDFLSTLGGLWGPLYMGALLLWLLLAKLPCLAATGGAHGSDEERPGVCK